MAVPPKNLTSESPSEPEESMGSQRRLRSSLHTTDTSTLRAWSSSQVSSGLSSFAPDAFPAKKFSHAVTSRAPNCKATSWSAVATRKTYATRYFETKQLGRGFGTLARGYSRPIDASGRTVSKRHVALAVTTTCRRFPPPSEPMMCRKTFPEFRTWLGMNRP
jgi:hypothetical protein